MSEGITDRNPRSTAIARFYDQLNPRLLGDYIFQNHRCAAGIARVCSQIDRRISKVLDIGCGIGASSDAYLRRRPWCRVDGVDISPQNIETAKRLFERDGLAFHCSDMQQRPTSTTYDLIALLDVYEHVPRTQWPRFNALLSECLSPEGIVVVAIPSPLHQQYLAQHKPEELQIVDETVDFDDIAALARDLQSRIVTFEMVSIWNSNDYIHVVMAQHPLRAGPECVGHARYRLATGPSTPRPDVPRLGATLYDVAPPKACEDAAWN